MPKFLDVKQWPRVLWQNPLLFLTAVLLGATTAFIYSYAPLHRAKDWKIEYLDERLSIRSKQARELEAELRKAREALEGTPSGEELGALRAQLREATRLASAREKEMESLSQKLRSAQRSRDEWKSRSATTLAKFEALNVEPGTAAADPAPAAAADPEPPADAAEASPAAPAASRDDE